MSEKRYTVDEYGSLGGCIIAERDDLLVTVAALTARVAELKAAVLKYGWHDDTCNFLLEAIDCDCGLEALRLQCADSGSQ